jgi:urate oxidase
VFHPLAESQYGKSRVRLLKLLRKGDRHDLRDLTIEIRLEGEYEPAYTVGDNSNVLPTDTMKNTVYALARQERLDTIESFALSLSEHFVRSHAAVNQVTIEIASRPWKPLIVGEKALQQAFVQQGGEERTARVVGTRTSVRLEAGFRNLLVLKSSRSAFTGFLRDRFTTLPETADRILATTMTVSWLYGSVNQPFDPTWQAVRQVLLETFALHESQSVQHTLYALADAALENCEALEEIRFTFPNKHHLLVDLSPFGLDNPNEVFLPTEEPHGVIEGTVRRRRT